MTKRLLRARPHIHRTIGLLGGSFNPAHAGHVHISREALKRLGVDEVWWLVSPHNPLKNKADLADYSERLAGAQAMTAKEPRIRVTDMEQHLGTRYTADTLAALSRLFPHITFIWLMGADNLAGFHRWQRWQWVMQHYRIAVFDRAPFSHNALRSPAALRGWSARVLAGQALLLKEKTPPAWVYLPIRRSGLSGTKLRELNTL